MSKKRLSDPFFGLFWVISEVGSLDYIIWRNHRFPKFVSVFPTLRVIYRWYLSQKKHFKKVLSGTWLRITLSVNPITPCFKLCRCAVKLHYLSELNFKSLTFLCFIGDIISFLTKWVELIKKNYILHFHYIFIVYFYTII